ncbi:uncharacterized protein LOC113798552 [Dermatophagoides pteronyssinus]|uniref:uncharacterized protein LOC113798552 n=1 Tax=Dermatophagoides pteronyssinus TaxID=6956 RepID=UPI003F67A434
MSWRHSIQENNSIITTKQRIPDDNNNNDSKECFQISPPLKSSSLNDHYKQRRQQLCKNIFRHFPGRVPVIVEKLDTNIMLLMNKQQQQQQNSIRKIFNFNGKKFVNSSSSLINNDRTTTTTTTNRKKRFKFLVPYDCSVGQFQWILRNKIDLITTSSSSSNRAIYLIVKRTLPHASCLIGELYRQYQDNDGYLYIHYSDENTFGSSLSLSPSSPLPSSLPSSLSTIDFHQI